MLRYRFEIFDFLVSDLSFQDDVVCSDLLVIQNPDEAWILKLSLVCTQLARGKKVPNVLLVKLLIILFNSLIHAL